MKLKCMLCKAQLEVPDSPYIPKGWYCFECTFRTEIAHMRLWMADNNVGQYTIKSISNEEVGA
jgi:hypothetical protein